MSAFITIDYETFYRQKKVKGLDNYSLKTLTYEDYINHEEFKIFGAAIKINNEETKWVPYAGLYSTLSNLFPPGNRNTLLAHNAYFESAITEWVFKAQPHAYRCTMSMGNGIWPHASNSLEAIAQRILPKHLRKGKELVQFDNVSDLSPEQETIMANYAINDVNCTFEIYKKLYSSYPNKEEQIIDLTFRMWARRPFHADRNILNEYLQALHKKKHQLIEEFLTRDADKLQQFIAEKNVKKSKARASIEETILAGREIFPQYMEYAHGIKIPRKHSPTPKNPNNETWALSKKDLEFLKLQKDHQNLSYIWDVLMFARGDDIQRTERLLKHSAVTPFNPEGRLAVPLKVNGAHTKRFSGMNKINFQNFKRKSPHRTCLNGGPDNILIIGDSSNIESRVTFWFCEQKDKVEKYRNNEDQYNDFASKVYGFPVDRKHCVIDENGDETYPHEIEGFVGKICVLGLGFNMGPPKLWKTLAQGTMGGPQLFFEMSFVQRLVYLFRSDNAYVTAMWKRLEGIIAAMANENLEPYNFGCLVIEHQRIKLPSGLYLSYPGLKKSDEGQWVYWNGDFWKSLYGGLLLENIVQALARIIMTDMMLEIDALVTPLGGAVGLTVHDEIVTIIKRALGEKIKKEIEQIMETAKDWYFDIPLAAEVHLDTNYSK